ncbi:MAG TPA: hypothetical protein VK589_04400 [Chryseolinea sp.]|nr:hypothetical protein [Chryseolinea sp.]
MIASTPPLINGVSYTHAEVVVNILGAPVIGVTAIKYSDPQEITLNHATGHKPTSRGFGTVTPEGSITLTMEEVERLSQAAPSGRIQNIPDFPIGVNFATEDGKFTRHRLIKVRFKGRKTDSQVGNSQIEEELELSIADIAYK